MNETYTIDIKPKGDHLEIHVPELHITVQTKPGEMSRNAAFDAAHLAIEQWHLEQREQEAVKAHAR